MNPARRAFPAKRRVFATIFFPRWVEENPQATVLYQRPRSS
jgi:phenolic acid decarboxylase